MSNLYKITHWREFISQYGRAVNLHNLWCAWVYKHNYKLKYRCLQHKENIHLNGHRSTTVNLIWKNNPPSSPCLEKGNRSNWELWYCTPGYGVVHFTGILYCDLVYQLNNYASNPSTPKPNIKFDTVQCPKNIWCTQ